MKNLGEIVGRYSNPDGQSYGFLYTATAPTRSSTRQPGLLHRQVIVGGKTLNGSTNPISGVIALGSLARARGLAVGVMSDWDAMQPMRLTPVKAADAP